ncbi:hypothetical protein AXK11_01630 [Cephaloticoccus primus]|uniref:GCVT N-terminal domain-containing protein n=1 Tax=Cephaloticoccus primus TaxID=1548207 RepID=A0A139STU2_9BACT|nr:folate-binding protein YgfZ [Cephaloticoccus primus]KXU37880.1 hypothetical protein AXK11_01630 [Cephaloticoccus primus]
MNTAPVPSFFPWKPACWLRVEGPDAFDFLQGQLSNDLRALGSSGPGEAAGPREAVYGLWLNRKGRILGDGFVLRAGEERFCVCSYETSGEALRAHLESFIVADEVELIDESPNVAGLTLLDGAGAQTLLSDAGSLAPRVGGAFFTAPFGVRPGGSAGSVVEWVGPAAVREALVAELGGVKALSADEMERRRILAKIPAVPRDLGEGELPQEGGPDFERAAVSYTKGCYLGQEVMARVHSMGRVRRQLVQVCGHESLSEALSVPALPAPLYLGDKKVGELRTAAGRGPELIGLALVSLLQLPKEAERVALSFGPNGEPALVADLGQLS